MLKKLFKMLVLPSILLSLIITGCTIAGNEDLQNCNEEVSVSSYNSQPMKVLSNKTFFSLKQTYKYVAASNGYLFCLANGDNEYIDNKKGYGKNHRLHVRKMNKTTLYVPTFQYNFGNMWTHMDAKEGYLILYSKNSYDSKGKNFRIYSINSDGSLKFKNSYKLRKYWDTIKICKAYHDISEHGGYNETHVFFLRDDGSGDINFKGTYIYEGKLNEQYETKIDTGFTHMAHYASSDNLLLYKKYGHEDQNLYVLDIIWMELPHLREMAISPSKKIPPYLDDIHSASFWEIDDYGKYKLVKKFFFIKSSPAFGDNSHLKMYKYDEWGSISTHERSYLVGDNNKGWDNMESMGNYLIAYKESQNYENKRNFMIAKIVK